MFLKSLVVRGFKSFANKTTLGFEPGISVVVGPNGSGKSNVVDAICWVLGEQGPASLRGGKMADVIFAGSGSKAPLGMAEVQLTIDNSAGLLPIEFSEVSISRSLFRSGDSEYRLNGSVCRLLDIQEMLSDAGVGRAQHTIVGQGRVDQVLAADPVAIRNMIEEAAGVGKHRRRRERALRKIESCEDNLVHLADLLAEIRRQLKPLRQQAEIANRHHRVCDELKRVQIIQASRELAEVLDELGPQDSAGREEELGAREQDLARLDSDLARLEETRMASSSESARYRELQLRLSGALERLDGLRKLAEERGRALRAELAGSSEAGERARVQEMRRQIDLIEPELAEAVRVEQMETEEQQLVQEPADAARIELARGEEAVAAALKRRAEAAARVSGLERDRDRSVEAAAQASRERELQAERLEQLRAEFSSVEPDLQDAGRRLDEHNRQLEPAEQELRRADRRLSDLDRSRAARLEEVRSLEKEAAVLNARAGARSSVTRSRSTGKGPTLVLADVVELEPGHRRALEALIGPLDSVAVARARDEAAGVLDEHDPDQAVTVLVADRGTAEVAGAEPLLHRVKVLDPVAESVLANVFLARDRTHAIEAAGVHPDCVFLSPDGTATKGPQVSRGSAEVAELLAECEGKLNQARRALARTDAEFAEAKQARDRAVRSRDAAAKLRAQLEQELRARERRSQQVSMQLTQLAEALERLESADAGAQRRLNEVEAALPVTRSELQRAEQDLEDARKRRAERLASYDRAFAEAQQLRMRAGIAGERAGQLRKRKREAVEAFNEANRRLAGLAAKQEALTEAVAKAGSVVAIAGLLSRGGADWPREAEAGLTRARDEVQVSEQRLADLRARRAELAGRLEKMRAEVRNEDLRRGELTIRRRILEARIEDEMEADPAECVAMFGRRAQPPAEENKDPLGRLPSLDAEALRSRRTRLERELERMGNVNPLAAAEAETLAEREEFLAAQIDDVRTSRKDLNQVVTSVDTKIGELFASAFEDVAAQYEELFHVLFPRGKGRLRLAEPDAILDSGVEVEASPSGKSLKRLSLLSGGERAMAGLALLFAVFKARPSPFYILDEVEAALDDSNLQRFLGLLHEFRGTSQLLVVTHQKRTMEVADVLYGVTIGPDGVSKVVSERLKDFLPASVGVTGSHTQRTGVNEQ
ncbi:MAG: chromosome segregation protein SMC [Actinomycetota bacterium]